MLESPVPTDADPPAPTQTVVTGPSSGASSQLPRNPLTETLNPQLHLWLTIVLRRNPILMVLPKGNAYMRRRLVMIPYASRNLLNRLRYEMTPDDDSDNLGKRQKRPTRITASASSVAGKQCSSPRLARLAGRCCRRFDRTSGWYSSQVGRCRRIDGFRVGSRNRSRPLSHWSRDRPIAH